MKAEIWFGITILLCKCLLGNCSINVDVDVDVVLPADVFDLGKAREEALKLAI